MLVTTAVDLCVSQHYLSDLGPRFIHEHPSFTETFRVGEQDVEIRLIQLVEDDDVGWIRLWHEVSQVPTQRLASLITLSYSHGVS